MKSIFTILTLTLYIYSYAESCKSNKFENLNPKTNKEKLILYNNSNYSLSFYYYDSYQQQIRFHIRAKSSYQILSDKSFFLFQSNKTQNFYLLKPKDSLTIELSKNGGAIFKSSFYPEQNQELYFSVKMNDSLPLNFWVMLQYLGKYQNSNYRLLDSLYQQEYLQRIDFLNREALNSKLSSSFIKSVNAFFIAHFLSSQLFFIGIESKDKISSSYQNYLFSLKDTINKLSNNGDNEWLNRLQYTYIKYLMKKYWSNKDRNDSLYLTAEKDLTSNVRREVLFLIVSEELNTNILSSKWFIMDYISKYSNSNYTEYIKSLFNNQRLLYSNNKTDSLVTTTTKKLSYKEIINKFKGKLIYIDVWASWCIPCRSEMPAAGKVRNIYYKKPIAFLYLSIDENYKQWQKASIDEKLEQSDGTYLISNFPLSEFKRVFKINTIPRYILIGKNGNIINSNAPRPSEKMLLSLIEKYL